MKLYLIGLPGSGKSSLGKKLAEEAKIPFIDLDDVIEQEAGISISKIFAEKGEEYFRSLEAVALRQQSKAPEFVMACGGGTPCFHDNMKFINEAGTSFFLNIALEEIINRFRTTNEQGSRPLLAGSNAESLEQKLSALLTLRLPFYSQASITLDQLIPSSELLRKILKS
jgi:shikimate kinase